MNLKEYVMDNSVKNIAVYGMNDYGKKWYHYLQSIQSLQHVFGIEKLNFAIETEYEKYMLFEDELPPMDAVLIIPWREYDFVKWELYSFVPENCIFMSVQDFQDELI